jgi:hypothetical protein
VQAVQSAFIIASHPLRSGSQGSTKLLGEELAQFDGCHAKRGRHEAQGEQVVLDAWSIGLRALHNARAAAQESRLKDDGEATRKNVDGISDEIPKAPKALDLLLRRAKSTLRLLFRQL